MTDTPVRSRRRALARFAAVSTAAAAVLLAAATSAVAATSPDGFNADPNRLLDTRIDLPDHPAGPIDGFTQVTVPDSVPSNGSAVLSITIISPTTGGFVKVYPDGQDAPVTADVNFAAGPTWAQSVIVSPGPTGKVDLAIGGNTAPLNMIVDVIGSFPQASYTSLSPAQRVYDTRTPGVGTAAGKKSAGIYAVTLPTGDTGVPTNADAVAITLTQTGALGNGYLTALSGSTPTGSSAVNFAPGTIASNLVWVKPVDGKIYLQVFGAPTDVIVDLKGYATSGSVTAMSPSRISDTRSGLGGPTGPVAGNVSITAPSGAPAGATYALLNVTATQVVQGGYVSSFQATGGALQTSSLNYNPGQTVAGFVLAPISAGKITFYVGAGATNVATDIEGYVVNAQPTG